MATLVPRYTAQEIRRFPDDRLRYEVIRGELFVTPAPGTALRTALHTHVPCPIVPPLQGVPPLPGPYGAIDSAAEPSGH